MHDCSIARGDRFLAGLVPLMLAALGPRGVLFVTFDEGTSRAGCCLYASGGRIVTIAAGPGARPGRYAQPMDHYSLLRAIEDRWTLDRLGRAASPRTPSLDVMLKR
jgi:acid phosphatase